MIFRELPNIYFLFDLSSDFTHNHDISMFTLTCKKLSMPGAYFPCADRFKSETQEKRFFNLGL
jgi:hypothetical protein